MLFHLLDLLIHVDLWTACFLDCSRELTIVSIAEGPHCPHTRGLWARGSRRVETWVGPMTWMNVFHGLLVLPVPVRAIVALGSFCLVAYLKISADRRAWYALKRSSASRPEDTS